MRHIDTDSLKKVILECVYSHDSIPAMFSKIYDTIHLPLNYFDTAFQLVANAFPRPFSYGPWESMAENHGASNEEIVNLGYLRSQEQMCLAGKTLLFSEGCIDLVSFPQACGPVLLNGVLLGYMGTMVEDAYPEEVIAINDIIIKAIVILSASASPNDSVSNLRFESLLTQESISHSDASAFEAQYPAPYIFMTIRSDESAVSTMHYINYLIRNAAGHLIGCVFRDDSLYVLAYSADINSKAVVEMAARDLAGQFHVSAGISDLFFSIEDIHTSILQADLALSVGKQFNMSECVYTFNKEYNHILSVQSYECAGPSFMDLMTDALIKFNNSEDTDYIGSLQAYLNCQNRISSVSEQLGIHKNTVAQRLRKIESITGYQLDDLSCSDSLEMQFLLCDAAETLKEVKRD